jgi:hypothetical protein
MWRVKGVGWGWGVVNIILYIDVNKIDLIIIID